MLCCAPAATASRSTFWSTTTVLFLTFTYREKSSRLNRQKHLNSLKQILLFLRLFGTSTSCIRKHNTTSNIILIPCSNITQNTMLLYRTHPSPNNEEEEDEFCFVLILNICCVCVCVALALRTAAWFRSIHESRERIIPFNPPGLPIYDVIYVH